MPASSLCVWTCLLPLLYQATTLLCSPLLTKDKQILYNCFINNADTSVTIHEDIPSRFNDSRDIESLHSSLSLSTSTFPCHDYSRIDLDLSLHLHNLYHPSGGFKTTTQNQKHNSLHIIRKPNTKRRYRSYLGTATITTHTRNNITKSLDAQVSLTFLGNISQPSIESYSCQAFSAQIHISNQLAFSIKPIPTTTTTSHTCNSVTLSLTGFTKHFFHSNPSHSRRHLQDEDDSSFQSINRIDCSDWDEQWRHLHSVKVGLVIDQGFFSKFDSSFDLLEEYLSLILTNTNSVFNTQFNIHIALGDVFVTSDVPNYASQWPEWWMDSPPEGQDTYGCTMQDDQFSLIMAWNHAKYYASYDTCMSLGYDYKSLANCSAIDSHSAWLVMSRCQEGSGTAMVGGVCKTGYAASAVVNYERDETWLVFAHELGHLFGGWHNFEDGMGGIMDYDEQEYLDLHQFVDLGDMCYGIGKSRSSSSSFRPKCWSVYENSGLAYEWQMTGSYAECFPDCGTYRFSSEKVECVLRDATTSLVVSVVDDTNCGIELKPLGKFTQCDAVDCAVSVCGDAQWSPTEDCDPILQDDESLAFACCEPTECSWNPSSTDECVRLKRQVDAAFVDSSRKLFLFQDSQFAVYTLEGDDSNSVSIGEPDVGYPKLILDSFPISTWSSDFAATLCTPDDIVFVFKEFSFIRIDLSALHLSSGNAQLDAVPIPLITGSSSFILGYIPDIFGDCGHIDAAFVHSFDQATLVCDTLSYTWTLGSGSQLLENVYRPFFNDFPLSFGDAYASYTKLDAAAFDWRSQTLYFLGADVYVEFGRNAQSGVERKLSPMGYWTDNTNCQRRSSGCYTACEARFNGECYSSSYLAVIPFESEDSESRYWTSFANVHYASNGGVFSGTNAAMFTEGTKIALSLDMASVSVVTNWKVSVWLNPSSYAESQDWMHFVNEDGSHVVLRVGVNEACVASSFVTVSVVFMSSDGGDEEGVFVDSLCMIPLTMGEWNKVTVEANEWMVAVTVNSKVEASVAIESQGVSLALTMDQVYLGTSFVGLVDWFVLQMTDGYVSYVDVEIPTDAAACLFPFVGNVREMVAWLSVFVVLYSVCMWAFYKYYAARMLLNQVTRHMQDNAGGQQHDKDEDVVLMQEEQEEEKEDNHLDAGVRIMLNAGEDPVKQDKAARMALGAIEEGALGGNQATPRGAKRNMRLRAGRNNEFIKSPQRIMFQGDADEDSNRNPLLSPYMTPKKRGASLVL